MRYKRVLPHIFFAILVGFFVLFAQPSPTSNQIENTRETAKVLRVIDGDTIRVEINNKEDTVRLIGIDAPETVDPRKNVECFGRQATEKAKEILDGKTIILESDSTQPDRDKYGRLLRFVFIDNLNVNKLMISQGYAHEYTYQSNPYEYQLEFIAAEKSAREGKKGLWSDVVKCNRE